MHSSAHLFNKCNSSGSSPVSSRTAGCLPGPIPSNPTLFLPQHHLPSTCTQLLQPWHRLQSFEVSNESHAFVMSAKAGPSAAADTQAEKLRLQQSNRAQQQEEASEDRAKAQQNKERATQNRNSKGRHVKFADDSSSLSVPVAPSTTQAGAKSDPKAKASPASGAAGRQPKKQPKREASKVQTGARQGKPPTQFRSKVVVRRLPPNLPEEVFWRAVSPWVRDAADCSALTGATRPQDRTEGKEAETSSSSASLATNSAPTVDYKKFVAGKLKADANKQNKHARAYLRFLSPQSLVQFHKSFDGHIFRDSKGKESVAIVEFAPYQKVVLPNASASRGGRRAKPDPKQGTIDKDADYVAFVDRLSKADDHVKRSEGDLLASLWDPKDREREKEEAAEKGKSTPLLEHLRAVKMAKLESAAALKKAKKREKAATKAAAKGAAKGVAASASAAKDPSQTSKKEKGKGADAVESQKGHENAREKATIKRDRKKKAKDNSKTPNAGSAGAEAIATETNTGQKQAAAKPPPKGSSTSKKPDTKIQTGTDISHKAAGGEADGASKSKGKGTSKSKGKGKGKSMPPRKQGGANEKATVTATPSSAAVPTPAFQPAKVQILKRET